MNWRATRRGIEYGGCPRERVSPLPLEPLRYKRAPSGGSAGGGHVQVTNRWRIPAGRPKAGQLLSEAQQSRYQRAGLTKAAYESGAKLTAARGHGKTPEHGLKDAAKHPEKYQDYLRNRPTGGQLPPLDLDQLRNDAYSNVHDIMHDHHAYNDQSVILRIMGDPDDPANYPGMSVRELRITKNIRTMREIQDLAASQRGSNPWWYH